MDDQQRILQAMTPAQKIRALDLLCQSWRQLKAATLRAQHPEWTEADIQRAVRDAFLYARD